MSQSHPPPRLLLLTPPQGRPVGSVQVRFPLVLGAWGLPLSEGGRSPAHGCGEGVRAPDPATVARFTSGLLTLSPRSFWLSSF